MNKEEKFNELLVEYNSLKEKHDALFIKITKKFVDIGANISQENPTDAEMSEWESVSDTLYAIDKRIQNLFK